MPFYEQKSLSEIEEESARADAEIALAQKKQILAGLKKNGLTLKNFGNSLRAALHWLKYH